MKKGLSIFLVILGLFIFYDSLLSLVLNTSVKGWKYVGLNVDGSSTNGYAHFVFNNYYIALHSGNLKEWKQCKRINPLLQGYIENNIRELNLSSKLMYISEPTEFGFRTYIQVGNKLIYIRGFPDFGGKAPSEEEKKICSESS